MYDWYIYTTHNKLVCININFSNDLWNIYLLQEIYLKYEINYMYNYNHTQFCFLKLK